MKIKFLVFGLLSVFSFLNSQELVTEFVHKDGDEGSSPSGFVQFNDKLIFTAVSKGLGREIRVLNANESESYLLKDIYPGNNDGVEDYFSNISVEIDNILYFIATDGTSDGELWKTDGTHEGTIKITNFLNSKISKLTLVNNQIYFLIQKSDSLQLWVSDGTTLGTNVVKENMTILRNPSFQGRCNNTFIFTFTDLDGSTKVWRSDGTLAGTYPITDDIDGNGGSASGTDGLTQYIEFNNELYFVSRNFLHKTDGTVENTKVITSLYEAKKKLIDFADVVEANGKLYFSFFLIDHNRLFIWETDGTESGVKKYMMKQVVNII